MIEIRTYTGADRQLDTGYAEDAEGAIVAARAMLADARTGTTLDKGRFVRILVDDVVIRTIEERDLWRYTA